MVSLKTAFPSFLFISSFLQLAIAAANSAVCEQPDLVRLTVNDVPNARVVSGELRSLAPPGGQLPLGIRHVVPLECSRINGSSLSWKLIWSCYETENSDPAYSARIFDEGGMWQAVVLSQREGEAERALYELRCLVGDQELPGAATGF